MKLISTIIFTLMMFTNGFAGEINNVLIVSIDALHPDALGSKTSPHIYQLMNEGAYTLDGHSTDPPLTLIAHTSMFTGLSPEQSGRTDNEWHSGDSVVQKKTIFDTAKTKRFSTGYFYSKEKQGFLVNSSIDKNSLSEEFAIEESIDFIEESGRYFVFLHISGLDIVGQTDGWLSSAYMEELLFIDERLEPLIKRIKQKKNYLMIITSDHAGHGTTHGTNHPEDKRLPFIIVSDKVDVKQFQNKPYRISELNSVLNQLLK